MSDHPEEPKLGASQEECTVGIDDDGEEAWDPFEQEEAGVTLDSRKVTAEDGMPSEHAPVQETDIPPLRRDTLICMADTTDFVWRDEWGDIIVHFGSEGVELSPNGDYRMRREDVERILHEHELELEVRDRVWVTRPGGARAHPGICNGWLRVDPIRPACRHYLRQCTQFSENAARKFTYRLCALRRTTEGAMMAIWDRGVWACDWRDPRHLESEAVWLDRFDEKLMSEGQRRKMLNLFEVLQPGEADRVGIEVGQPTATKDGG
jgi:hypothetical protein